MPGLGKEPSPTANSMEPWRSRWLLAGDAAGRSLPLQGLGGGRELRRGLEDQLLPSSQLQLGPQLSCPVFSQRWLLRKPEVAHS